MMAASLTAAIVKLTVWVLLSAPSLVVTVSVFDPLALSSGVYFKPSSAALICRAVPRSVMLALLLAPATMVAPELVLPSANVPSVVATVVISTVVKVVVCVIVCVIGVTATGRATAVLTNTTSAADRPSATVTTAAFPTVLPVVSLIGYQARKPAASGLLSVCISARI